MPLSSIIVQADSLKIEKLTHKLNSLPGVSVQTNTSTQIIALIEAATLEKLEAMAFEIERMDDVLGVYPVYVTKYDEEDDGEDDDGYEDNIITTKK